MALDDDFREETASEDESEPEPTGQAGSQGDAGKPAGTRSLAEMLNENWCSPGPPAIYRYWAGDEWII